MAISSVGALSLFRFLENSMKAHPASRLQMNTIQARISEKSYFRIAPFGNVVCTCFLSNSIEDRSTCMTTMLQAAANEVRTTIGSWEFTKLRFTDVRKKWENRTTRHGIANSSSRLELLNRTCINYRWWSVSRRPVAWTCTVDYGTYRSRTRNPLSSRTGWLSRTTPASSNNLQLTNKFDGSLTLFALLCDSTSVFIGGTLILSHTRYF